MILNGPTAHQTRSFSVRSGRVPAERGAILTPLSDDGVGGAEGSSADAESVDATASIAIATDASGSRKSDKSVSKSLVGSADEAVPSVVLVLVGAQVSLKSKDDWVFEACMCGGKPSGMGPSREGVRVVEILAVLLLVAMLVVLIAAVDTPTWPSSIVVNPFGAANCDGSCFFEEPFNTCCATSPEALGCLRPPYPPRNIPEAASNATNTQDAMLKANFT